MKFKIFVDDAERLVDAAADGTLLIDGSLFKAKVSGGGAEKRTVQVGEKTHEVRIVRCNEGEGAGPVEYLLELAGERVPVAIKDVTKGVPQAASARGVSPAATPAAKVGEDYKDGILAPVPGKILDIKVKVGDTVKKGDLVLILEAMKMENELHSPKQATVAAVLVSKGDQATKGQMLVAFE